MKVLQIRMCRPIEGIVGHDFFKVRAMERSLNWSLCKFDWKIFKNIRKELWVMVFFLLNPRNHHFSLLNLMWDMHSAKIWHFAATIYRLHGIHRSDWWGCYITAWGCHQSWQTSGLWIRGTPVGFQWQVLRMINGINANPCEAKKKNIGWPVVRVREIFFVYFCAVCNQKVLHFTGF